MKSIQQIASGAPKSRYSGRIQLVLIILCITASTQAQSLIPELSFKNPVLKTGRGCMGDGLDGAVYIFENVGWGMDALVNILGRSGPAVTLSNIDIQGPEQNTGKGTGFDNAWQPGIKFGDGHAPAHQAWWMEFKISFVSHTDHETFMPVSQFYVDGLDIDGDGKELHEFQAYYKTESFKLEQQTAIFTSTVQGSETDPLVRGKRFDGPVKNYPGISVKASDAMVRNFYAGSPSMVVRLGAVTGNLMTTRADRMYGLLFKSLASGMPKIRVEPVNLIASSINDIK